MNSSKQKIISLYSSNPFIGFFTKIRFWTGSFTQIEEEVPRSGTILDLGCGYGIFTNYLGLSSKRRHVMGVDLDRKKLAHADKGIHNVSFRYADATKMNISNLHGILLLDVLHHLTSYEAQEKLLRTCVGMLRSGGKLIIHEVDTHPIWKLPIARLADFILYPMQKVHYRYRSDLYPLLVNLFGKGQVKTIPMFHNPFPHLIYICQKK